MRRMRNFLLWCLGVFLLIVIMRLPVKPGEIATHSWSFPLAGQTIVIDPGHGGPDGGAVGADETSEKEIALEVAKKLRDYLQQAGALVYMTRETDQDLAHPDTKGLSRRKSEDIRNRLKFIHEKEADFFISIHLNAIPSTVWHGAQTFYYPKFEESKHLSKMIQAEIIRNLQNTTRSALAINGIYLLKYAEVPGSLVEIGFLSNVKERENLKKDDYQRKMAISIYQGILRYVTEEAPSATE